MVFHKVTTHDDVAIHLNDVLTLTKGKSLVHNHCLAEALVFLPNILNRQPFLKMADNMPCGIGGPIVGNDDLIWLAGLVTKAEKA